MKWMLSIGLVLVLWAPTAFPCSCRSLPVESQIDLAAYVFRARVTSAELVTLEPGELDDFGGEFVKAKVEILAILKGTPHELEGVLTPSEGPACGVPIVIGLDYVFFLTEKGTASRCGGTLLKGAGSIGSSGEWFDFVRRYGLAPLSDDRF